MIRIISTESKNCAIEGIRVTALERYEMKLSIKRLAKGGTWERSFGEITINA